MFARNISINLKPNMLADFTKTFEQDILPVLRKQKGFRDELTLSASDSNRVNAISLWDTKENADAYNTGTYPEVVKLLGKVIDGDPRVRTSEVVHSTAHKLAAGLVL
jgi:heme-degrading monooxygenase HmoA